MLSIKQVKHICRKGTLSLPGMASYVDDTELDVAPRGTHGWPKRRRVSDVSVLFRVHVALACQPPPVAVHAVRMV